MSFSNVMFLYTSLKLKQNTWLLFIPIVIKLLSLFLLSVVENEMKVFPQTALEIIPEHFELGRLPVSRYDSLTEIIRNFIDVIFLPQVIRTKGIRG